MHDEDVTFASDDVADHAAPIRIVLADDHAVVRSGLRLLLDAEKDFEVVAEAGDVESAARYVRGHHPAVLVLPRVDAHEGDDPAPPRAAASDQTLTSPRSSA